MHTKPTYLGLLNAIAVGESNGHQIFTTWAGATSNNELRGLLELIAIREAEHAAAFSKRIAELGYQLRPRKNKALKSVLKLASSDASDKKEVQTDSRAACRSNLEHRAVRKTPDHGR